MTFADGAELVALGLLSKETKLPNEPAGGGGRGGAAGFGGTPGPFNGCNHPPLRASSWCVRRAVPTG